MQSDKTPGDVSEDRIAEVKANIERFLDKHTREGGVALQHNMAARPAKWRIIDPQADESPRHA
jgi:hypothetical protein